jgi:RNA polymerase sigma factor (sigma-70 family)
LQIDKVSEEELVELLQDKNTKEKGFRVLVLQYQERLYWHVRRIVKTHEDTDDVLQNIFIKIYRNINKFKGDSKLYTWLYRIATNESLTFLKQQQRHATETIDNPDFDLSERLTAESEIEGKTIQDILQKAINELPEKQKLVFNMRYFEELSYQAISEILGTSEGALKASYHHASKKIEEFVKRYVEFNG